MRRNQKKTSAGGAMILFNLLLNAIVLEQALTSNQEMYSLLLFTIPLLVISIIASRSRTV